MTLNIGAAAVPRAEMILRWLSRRRPDVLVLTETSAGAGSELLAAGLEARGYTVVWTQPSADRGVMLATRLPVQERLCSGLDVTLPWRIAGVQLATVPRLAILGVYVPSRDRSPEKIDKKERFIASFLRSLQKLSATTRDELLIAGDYNAVSRRHSPPRNGFLACEYGFHEELERLGFLSGHELVGTRAQPYSWIGRTGDGYLYDYFHLGRGLHEKLASCRYLHDTRERGISDHAAVAVNFV